MLNKNVRIEVVGANLVGLMQDIQLSGIIADFKRTSDTALEIKTTKDNLPLLFAILQKKCYTYKVFEARGVNKSYFIGASIGVAIFFIFILVLMQFCFGIRVVSTDESVSRQVQEVVNSSGVIGQPWSKIDCAKLEQQVLEQIESIATLDERACKLIKAFMPGPLTLVLRKRPDAFTYINNAGARETDEIAVRMISSIFLNELIEKVGSPLFLTSANKSGMDVCRSLDEIEKECPTLDGMVMGDVSFGEASTIVDLTHDDIKIQRQGPISEEEIMDVLKK